MKLNSPKFSEQIGVKNRYDETLSKTFRNLAIAVQSDMTQAEMFAAEHNKIVCTGFQQLGTLIEKDFDAIQGRLSEIQKQLASLKGTMYSTRNKVSKCTKPVNGQNSLNTTV